MKILFMMIDSVVGAQYINQRDRHTHRQTDSHVAVANAKTGLTMAQAPTPHRKIKIIFSLRKMQTFLVPNAPSQKDI